MNIQHIQQLYGDTSQAIALLKALKDTEAKSIFLKGLVASAAPVFFSGVAARAFRTMLFILQDADEAGYFYHDLMQVMGQENVLFFPSSYRRAIKYGQRDSANEILRTEVLTRICSEKPCYIVTSPEAVAELVVSKQQLNDRTLRLTVGQTFDVVDMVKTLRNFNFKEVDYVYEPGQFAVRGSIVDIFSYSSEWPFRIDFFGDEIDTIRTFDVENQLSKDKKSDIEIVPEPASLAIEKIPFLHFLPKDAILVMKDLMFIRDTIDCIYNEGFSSQAITERMEGLT